MLFKNMKYILSLFTVFVLMVATAQVPSYVPTDSLIGYWPFNGNANDESGNGNNGTVFGATLDTNRYGDTSSAYSFDYSSASFGSRNNEIYIEDTSILDMTKITVSVWVKPAEYYWSGNPAKSIILNRYEGGYSNPNGQVWGLQLDQNNIRVFLLEASTSNTQNSINLTSITTIPLNVWSHLLFTYDSSQLKLYIDGSLVSSVSSNLSLNTQGSSGISIGESRQANGYFHPFSGNIDDIAIWKRALDSTEIQNLYSGSACTYYDTVTTQITVYDTIITQIFDTTTFNDTITYYDTTVVFDTVNIYVVDTSYISISVTDTLFIDITVTGMTSMDNTITVYPNPANDVVIIDNGNYSSMSNYSLVIVNSLSQQVFTSQINTQQFQIPVSTLGAEGTYFIQIFDENNNLVVTKYLVLN